MEAKLLEERDELDLILVPVGGGGLLSGSAIAASGMHPSVEVVGVEPQAADDAFRSFQAGKLIPGGATDTVADGLRTSLGELTFACIRKYVHDIVTVSEEEIVAAMRFIWERMKIVVEPSGAVPVAGLLNGKIETKGKKIGVILSGGNADLDRLPWQD